MPTHSLKVDQENDQLRLDVFLTRNLPEPPSRNFIQGLIDQGLVTVNKKSVKAGHKVSMGDSIVAQVEEEPFNDENIKPEKIALDIFFEDKDLVVINKPVGMLVHPAQGIYTGTLVNAILHHCKKKLSDVNEGFRPGIVHRLDRETSGLIVVAKNNKTHANLARQFEKRSVRKRYLALVEGLVEFDEGLIDASLGRHPRHRDKKAVVLDEEGRHAKTFYKVIKRFKRSSLVAFLPKTGRTHQLRVHAAYLGHPILGDDKYGDVRLFSRLALHAQCLGFFHPGTTKYVEFCTLPPAEFVSHKDN